MYRARVQAVSGGKVYADGKWLTCIGNKNFITGEMVWTDGRCAYGNFQESQQPLVITAPDDEGIPIAFRDGKIYTFRRNNLKEIEPIYDENIFYHMINDKKERVLLTSRILAPYILAENIDNYGNVYVLSGIAWSPKSPEDPAYIFITKNNELVKKIDLAPFIEETYKATPASEENFRVISQEAIKRYTEFFGAFIENEDNWGVAFSTSSAVVTTYNIASLVIPVGNGRLRPDESITLEFLRLYYLSPNKNSIMSELTSIIMPNYVGSFWLLKTLSGFIQGIDLDRPGCIKITHQDKEINKIKFPLQDDYYYKIPETKVEDFIWHAGEEYYPHITYETLSATIYSPNNKEIFTITCSLYSRLLLKKIGNSYLFGILNSGRYHEENMKDGLYLYKNGNFKLLVEGSILNHRLRPMKKIKGWQNRIKEISTEQIGLEISKAEN